MPTECQNCGRTEKVATVSFDMDLPVVTLCWICRVTITAQPDMFEEMSRERRRR